MLFKLSKRFFAIVLTLSMAMALSLPAFAYSDSTYRASEQLTSYSMNVMPVENGRIAISFSVDGTGKMTRIGAESIVVYQQVGNTWVYANSLDQYDDGMSTTNSYYFGNTIYFNGIPGEYYRVELTIFAKDSSGSDSRMRTFYVTA